VKIKIKIIEEIEVSKSGGLCGNCHLGFETRCPFGFAHWEETNCTDIRPQACLDAEIKE
jgi:hypothetical protein